VTDGPQARHRGPSMNHLLTLLLAAAVLLPPAGSASAPSVAALADTIPAVEVAAAAAATVGAAAGATTAVAAAWHIEPRITFYGPGGHYGRRTACGQTLTTQLVGVATYLYPCGTRIEFQYRGRTVIAPVVDRGPASWTGFRFDLTGRACVNLVGSYGPCWTIYKVAWRVLR
jgi:hypothetical protein